ncbi:DUF2066 domain-containing protein [Thalassolituus sp. LLYu03]|uniref:DUF2066 domain-containing protein n=1 Tax=Thalassolituus sp. LLYu03 TaxID=3421656 RepID=UPI003D29D2D9
MRALFLMMLWGLSLVSHAVTVSDLYQVRVPVSDQSSASRQSGLQEAFLQLVVKVTGKRDSAQNDAVLSAASNADRFVKSFRFFRDTASGLQLEVVFAQNLFDDLLRDARLPVWGKSRPLVLVWLGVEADLQRAIVGPNQAQWKAATELAMNERGIPLLWPALDLEDNMALSVEQLWGLFRADIATASERYMADAVLAGRLTPKSGGFGYRGFLKLKDEFTEVQAEGSSEAAVLAQVADQVSAFMAARFAVVSSESTGGFQIQVGDVTSFKQYQDVLNYLKANVAIKAVRVVSVTNQMLTLELDLSADWAQVWTTLALDRRLLQTEQESVYNWRH